MRKAQTVISQARIEQLRMMPYAEYIQTPEWLGRQRKALQEAQHCCQLCHAEDIQLNVYHRSDAHRGQEPLDDLLVVCEECHSKFSRQVVQSRALLLEAPLSEKASHWLVGGGSAVLLVPIMDFAMQWGIFGVILGGGVSAAVGYVWGPQIIRFLQRRGIATPALPRLSGETWERLTQPTYPVDTQAARPAITVESSATTLPDEQNSLYPRTNRIARTNKGSVSHDEIHELEQLLDEVLASFQIQAQVLRDATVVGPRIIRFGVVPTGTLQMEDDQPKQNEKGQIAYAKRTRIKEITEREKDIQLALGATSIRILSPVPGKQYVGIEIPNPKPTIVTLADVLNSPEYRQACASSKLVFALGRDVSGHVRFCDIEKAPHLLIGGTTNAGKSVLLNVLIASLLTNATPEDVRLFMIDPKMVELTPYNGIAHLLEPVVTEMTKVTALLDKAITETERRLRIFVGLSVRNLAGYRRKREQMPELENLPAWVIIIDEFADLMMTASKEDDIEGKICRLAQKARATGIHLVIATQRPVVAVITGLIKANLPTRIALKTLSNTDSHVILDQGGAEDLLGNGDLLYLAADSGTPIRIQGAYMTDAETEALAAEFQTDAYQAESDPMSDQMRTTEASVSPKHKLDTETITSWYESGRIGQTQFLILHKQVSDLRSAPRDTTVEAPPVPEQTLARIREMKARRYDDEDIIVLVGLRNNPALYQQALVWLENHPVEPERSQQEAYTPPPKLVRPAYKYEEYYEVTEEAYRLGYTGKRKLADFIKQQGKSFKVEPVGENKALHIINEMRDRGMLIDEELDESEEEHAE